MGVPTWTARSPMVPRAAMISSIAPRPYATALAASPNDTSTLPMPFASALTRIGTPASSASIISITFSGASTATKMTNITPRTSP